MIKTKIWKHDNANNFIIDVVNTDTDQVSTYMFDTPELTLKQINDKATELKLLLQKETSEYGL